MFKLTEMQEKAYSVMCGDSTHCLLEGGSRSGKTSLHVRNIILRALKSPESRHAILRYRLNHLKQSIIFDTLPKILKLAFPDVAYTLNKTDFILNIGEGSQIFFGGLDQKERTEKILGTEFSTIYLNECSQIDYHTQQMLATRLAQRSTQIIKGREPVQLKNRMLYDWNPVSKGHWIYKMFHLGIDPESGKPLSNLNDYCHFKLNPKDNLDNLSPEYLKTLESMSARMRKRFVDGEAADISDNLLFNDVDIEKWRITDGIIPEFVRIVVGVDPSGSGDTDNENNDAIGIVVGGLGTDGNAYLIEDCTVKASPHVWGNVAVLAYERHEANMIVAEVNYGGAMVKHVIQTARPKTPFKETTSTRGKSIRAEPFSALYEQGRIRHIGFYRELEDEMCQFSTNGYLGNDSPNRADAWIFVLSELFAGIVKERKLPPKSKGIYEGSGSSFMQY